MRQEPMHKCVWILHLPKVSYAVRLLVYRNQQDLQDEYGHAWPS